MILNPITDGTISGTGTVICASKILGGVLITADGTNNATIIVRKENSAGKKIFHIVTKSPLFVMSPIANRDGVTDASNLLYYDISGTGASAQLYEWIT